MTAHNEGDVMQAPHCSWRFRLLLPWDDFQQHWRLRDLNEADLDFMLKEILKGVRVVNATQASDARALEIMIHAQTG